ncbi:unnamed protein product [Notodromas monacha]|uniref:Uncharacterized protein n=1 Tax=Notodromas monacha TaxID=399045 RepID=A0A7R9BYF6_9CRUS|nr:unnamed protein product [Notodromas monacha]CAG0922920.1 unnamed protein product [Notodromas monacha]
MGVTEVVSRTTIRSFKREEAPVSIYFPTATQDTLQPLPLVIHPVVPERHILAFHHELTEAYLQEIYGDIYALTGYRIKAPFESSTPVLLSHLSAVIPFPGAIAADQSNVNSYFNNKYYGSIGKVDEATVSGTQCNPTSLILVAGGELNTKSAACISMRSEPGLCGKIPVGSAVVVLGADNNQYLVALTRFGADCNGTHAGVSLAFPSHKDFICSFSDVNCSNALPAVPTTTQNPTTTIVLMNATTTTQNSVLTTSNSINTNNTTITTTQTIQARTTDAQGSNGDGSNQDRPNQSKFWSILRLLIDAFAGQGK